MLVHRFLFLIQTGANLLFYILLRLPTSTTAYASWLKCRTDLNDPTEVIMNHRIVPAHKSRAPHVKIRAWTERGDGTKIPFESDSSLVNKSMLDLKDDFGNAEKDSEDGQVFQYWEPGTIVKLDLETAGDDFLSEHVQFVMDIVNEGNNGRFMRGKKSSVQCNGSRGIGQREGSILSLILMGGRVEVIAGWAAEHEAVTLTEKVVFVQAEQGIDDDSEEEL